MNHSLKPTTATEQEKRFLELLQEYKNKDGNYNVLELAYDLFLSFDEYIKNQKAKDKQILKLLTKK